MRLKLPIAAVLVCILTGCASGYRGVAGALPAPNADAHTPLQPGDRIALKVWSDPELAGTFTVAVSGMVALPKVGLLPANQMDAVALQDSIIRAYTALMRDPAVEVTVMRRVGVVGEVRQPGIYYSDLSMTIADVIALAGGLTENGSPTRVSVLRGTQEISMNGGDGANPLGGVRSGDQIVVGSRGFWARNPGLLVSTLTGLFYFVISRIQ
jgi:polysaccharide export outer membrane protein